MSFFVKSHWLESWKPGLRLYHSSTLTSKVENYRQKIRQELLDILSESFSISQSDKRSLLNLDHLPFCEHASVSISHSPMGSCFVFDPLKRKIGIDIESSTRISDPIIKRISNEDELKGFPIPALSFSMKEAAWKALHQDLNIATISEITLTGWSENTTQGYNYYVSFSGNQLPGQGYCLVNRKLHFACFVN